MMTNEHITKFYKYRDLNDGDRHFSLDEKLGQLRKLESRLCDLKEEQCYYVASTQPLETEERNQILWLIEPNTNDFVVISDTESHLRASTGGNSDATAAAAAAAATATTAATVSHHLIIEIGPRLNFCSPFSTNAVSILRSSCPSTSVYRLEQSTIYQLTFSEPIEWGKQLDSRLFDCLYDKMVETIYEQQVHSFHPNAPRAKMAAGELDLQPSADVQILERGEEALRDVSTRLGLFFDDWDIAYYVGLFRDKIKRNPTVVECFDLAQSNSEHSRHWFFKGVLDIEGRRSRSDSVCCTGAVCPAAAGAVTAAAAAAAAAATSKASTDAPPPPPLTQAATQPQRAKDESLIDMVASTQLTSNQNNVIKFEDNSSAIRGFDRLSVLRPRDTSRASQMDVVGDTQRHIIFTAETHNFPTGVAPFPGAATGTGGRIRDVQATGRGAHVVAGTAGYSFGNLLLDEHELDWENPHELYPHNLARASKIAVEASNGASDYGNKFGEPIVAGFARSFGMRLMSQERTNKSERFEYLKPIMFTGGIGTIDAQYIHKTKPERGMKVAKIGGPVYRIGIGGGAASSAVDSSSPSSNAEQKKLADQLNFNAVQRGDPEMEQKLNRVIRACIENTNEVLDTRKGSAGDILNPILSIHDQGAGGNGNVLKEIVEPLGATIDANKFTLGDHTVNVLELWAAEYQESDAILMCASDKCQAFMDRVTRREKCQTDVVGQVDSEGQIRLLNFADYDKRNEKKYPIDLKLDYVIGSMPRKVFKLQDYNVREYLQPARLIEIETPAAAAADGDPTLANKQQQQQQQPSSKTKSRVKYTLLNEQMYALKMASKSQMMSNFEHLLSKVLKLPSVGSKRYLTTKVDRCVTGLVAGQQCLGPLHTPIGDYALIALTHFDTRGAVTSIGEQPIKGLVSPVANATMSVAEALTNMMFCVITEIADIKCSANWMWAAKLPGEGAKLLDACRAMCDLMRELGIAVDGGKDSLSMSANVDPKNASKLGRCTGSADSASDENDDDDESVETVKSPGTLVISAYAPVPDIRCKVTPIMRCKPKKSHLVYVNLAHPLNCDAAGEKFRLGGSAILQTLGQIGDEAPSIDHPELLRKGFELVQQLIREGICTAGHDVSDGGLIVCALEMAIASHSGLHLNIKAEKAFKDLSRANNDERTLGALFSEECAVVIEVEAETEQDLNSVLDRFEAESIAAQRIGFGSYENERVTVKFEQQSLLEMRDNHKIREWWESTSRHLDACQANKKCVQEEYDSLSSRPCKPNWTLTFAPDSTPAVVDFDQHYLTPQPRVAVLREEGINGDREMIASLILAGFEVHDVTVTDLTASATSAGSKLKLSAFQGLIFPGGFSYADVFGSGRGWAASLVFNRAIRAQLDDFRRRPNTFSLGVCNGCQLMSLLGFLDDLETPARSNKLVELPATTVRLDHNDSGRFECRFVNVRIETQTNSIMLDGMEDSVFGVWVAHGEGKFRIEQSVEVDHDTRVALKYVNDRGEPTMDYPANPNGSDLAAAGMCSHDGRHLAMMPHPERCTQLWQWPYVPAEWTECEKPMQTSPWLRMFVNAYDFCKQNQVPS